MCGYHGHILPLKQAPTRTRSALETKSMGDCDAPVTCSFVEDQLCTAAFSCTPHWSTPGSPPSRQTHLLPDMLRSTHGCGPCCPGGTRCCSGGTGAARVARGAAWEARGAVRVARGGARVAHGAGDTGKQRLAAVIAARLRPGESLCPRICRQGCFWWPA